MSSFDLAIDTVLAHEGGFVHHPDDPGGATNMGMTLRTVLLQLQLGELLSALFDTDGDGDIDTDDVKNWTIDHAMVFYRNWWNKYDYSRINDQSIATKLFDLSVNMGGRQSHRVLQRACRACGWSLNDDGIIGAKSIGAINSIRPDILLPSHRSEAAGFYRALRYSHPSLKTFLDGWLNRAYS